MALGVVPKEAGEEERGKLSPVQPTQEYMNVVRVGADGVRPEAFSLLHGQPFFDGPFQLCAIHAVNLPYKCTTTPIDADTS